MRRHLVKRHGKSASGQIAKGRSPLGAKGARTSALVCALMALAALALCMPAVAWADARAAEEDALWQPRASVSVEEAADGAVLVTATGENGGLTALRGADLELTVPEGLRVVEGEVRASAETVEPGGTLRVQATLSLADAGGAGGGAVKPLAGTGEGSVGALLAAAAVALAAFAAFALRRSRRARNAGRDAFCVLLAAGLAAGLAPASLAFAADGDAVEGAALEGTAHATAVLQGSSFELTARMRATSADPLPEDACSTVAWLSTEAHVAQGADRAHVSLVSDTPFAEDLSAASFSLEDAFSGCAVASANRASDTQVDLVIEGRVADDGSDGAVRAAADAFSEDVLCCMGVVPAEVPEARLLDADAGAGEGYNAADGLFALPLTIGSAEFLAGVSADRFSLPADGGVRVTAVEAVEGAHEARITLEVPGDDAEARFERLDAALTAGGVRIDAAAVNCGEMVAVSDDVARGQEAGYETTALEYVDATLFAVARVIDATVEADGSVELSCEASVEDADGGKVDLRSAGAFVDVARVPLAAVEDAAGADAACESASVVDAGTLAVTGPSTFVFRTTLPADQADVLEVLVDDADGCGAPANHIPDQAELADWALSLCQVSVGGGAVSNRWGIPVGAASAPLLTCSEAQVMARTPDLTPAEKAEKSLEAVQEALNAVGSFVRAFEGDADGCFQGAGSVFGCVAKLVGVMSPPVYTLADVMNRLDTIQSNMHDIERGVAGLGQQLESFESRSSYRQALNALSGYVSVLGEENGMSLLVCDAAGKVDVGGSAESFSQMSEADQEALRTLAQATSQYSAHHNRTTLELTKGLGALIVGNSAISASSVCELYYDYVDTYYNWEPQTFDARRQFLAYVGQAYLVGYMASMCELNVAIADAAPGSAELQAAKAAQASLVAQAEAVSKTISGEVDETGKIVKESSLSRRIVDRDDGNVLNLVTKSLFSTEKSSAAGGLSERSFFLECGIDFPGALATRDIDKVGPVTLSTGVSAAQFEEMAKRLAARKGQPGYEGPKNLAEEMASVGVPNGASFSPSAANGLVVEGGDHARAAVKASESQRSRYVVSVDDKRKTADYYAVYHAFVQTGDVYDTRQDKLLKGQVLYETTTKYWFLRHWSLYINFEDYRVWAAAASA